MRKFKYAGNVLFCGYSTDENGVRIPGTETGTFRENEKPGTGGAYLYAEMQKYIAGGGEIEPQYTPEELEENESKEAEAAAIAWIGLRKSAYPDPMMLNDALVKQRHDDEEIKAEGIQQEAEYYRLCLEVKVNIPKT